MFALLINSIYRFGNTIVLQYEHSRRKFCGAGFKPAARTKAAWRL